jgi:hypothetical protein
MKKILMIMAFSLVFCSMVGMISAEGLGSTSSGIGINPQFVLNSNNPTISQPLIWGCGSGVENYESVRKNDYAFEGEKIHLKVLVMDLKGTTDIKDIMATIGPSEGAGNDGIVECKKITSSSDEIPSICGANINSEQLTTFYPSIMSYYDCSYTVKSPDYNHGEYFLTVEAQDADGNNAVLNEDEYWFLNPVISLTTNSDLAFGNLVPGKVSYSKALTVKNDAEAGSGVMVDMFISGTDFTDESYTSGKNDISYCPGPGKLGLDRVRYFAKNAAFSTKNNLDSDFEGYLSLPQGTDLSNSKRIMRNNVCMSNYGYGDFANATRGSSTIVDADWNCGNALSPGSDMTLTFKVDVPELCVGNFDDGQIYLWGEAI